jgi:DNA-binding CsgD family transcriptional regulator
MVSYERARRFERELNERQREVLGLIADGKTNPEIAQHLGITLDGAKWHVSEILTRLGFATREEAGDFWRWRNRPMRRVGRALRPLLAWPIALGAAAAGVAAVLFGFALFGAAAIGGGDDVPIVPGSFYAEARVVERREGAEWKLESSDAAGHAELRWWYQDATHTNQEYIDYALRLTARTQRLIADGTDVLWAALADNGHDEYYRVPMGLLYEPGIAKRALTGPFFGPIAYPDIDSFVASLNVTQGNFKTTAHIAGTDTVLGYRTTVIEYGPTWAKGDPQTQGGVGRIWVDEEHRFILRSTREGNDGTEALRIEATKVTFGITIPADRFQLQTPLGAVVLGPGTPTATVVSGSHSSVFPPQFDLAAIRCPRRFCRPYTCQATTA